jgi:hypothetical protein
MSKSKIYSLNDFVNITFAGFDFKVPDKTSHLINELAQQVGSPSYIKTPIFKNNNIDASIFSSAASLDFGASSKNRRKGNKSTEIVTDSDWESLRTFQATVIEQKIGIDSKIDMIRSNLNKISDKTFEDIKNKIVCIINELIGENVSDEEIQMVGRSIFDIASTNRFYSKLYADLYYELVNKFDIFKSIFEVSFESFIDVFNTIEYIDPNVDYDGFCKINKINDKRRALSSFFLNLMNNQLITREKILDIVFLLINNVDRFILEENKKNEVDEISENINILCTKTVLDDSEKSEKIRKMIHSYAHSKAKSWPSMSNKTRFRFMDMIEM